jgi:hypothetical protein
MMASTNVDRAQVVFGGTVLGPSSASDARKLKALEEVNRELKEGWRRRCSVRQR